MTPDDCDYSRYGGSPRVWTNLVDFINGTLDPGVHVIHLPRDVHLDLYIVGRLTDSRTRHLALPVFFSGAISTRAGNMGPFFSGRRLGRELGASFVSIADPTLNHQHDLRLGWYAGRVGDGVQAAVAAVLNVIGRKTQRELLFIGGSGGGFAALQATQQVITPSSGIVWNPQTDLLDYSPNSVADYLTTALFSTRDDVRSLAREDRSRALNRGAITHQIVLQEGANPRRLLYLQNAGDTPVHDHALPLMHRSGFQEVSPGRYIMPTTDRVVWIADHNEGHLPPPTDVIERAVRLMLNPRRSAQSVATYLERGAAGDPIHPTLDTRLPRVSLLSPALLRVDASNIAADRYAFHLYRGKVRQITSPWQIDPVHEFPLPEAGTYRVRVFKRESDGSVQAVTTQSVHAPGNARQDNAE